MTRKQARDEAFILIFEKQFSDATTEEILELAKEVRDLDPDDYILKVFSGVVEKEDELCFIGLGSYRPGVYAVGEYPLRYYEL